MHIYGDIFSVKFLKDPAMIIVLGFDKMKEIFLHQADFTSNRPDTLWLINQLSNKNGNYNCYNYNLCQPYLIFSFIIIRQVTSLRIFTLNENISSGYLWSI